jgi:hypothetical protein
MEGGSDAASMWRRGGGGPDARCTECSRQLRASGRGGNGWVARGQGREVAEVRAHIHSTGWRQNLIQSQISNGFKLYLNSFKL